MTGPAASSGKEFRHAHQHRLAGPLDLFPRAARWRHRLLIPACCALVIGTAAACGSTGGSTGGSTAASISANAAGTSAPTSAPGATESSTQGSPTSAPDATGSSTRPVIMIHNFAYQIPTVNPGQTIGVMNMDSEAHTVTADSGNAFDVKATPGSTVTFTAPSKPGGYPFHCTYHSDMHGVLVVT